MATISSRTYGNQIEEEEKPKQVKALQSLKSIYLTQRGTCNDLFLFTSLKKNVHQQLHTISRKYETSRDYDHSQSSSRTSKLLLTTLGKESDTSDSKNSIESKIRKTPFIKNMVLQKIITTLPTSNKAESREDDSKSNPSLLSTSMKNPIALSNSAMKAYIKEPQLSQRVTPLKGKLTITKVGPNGEKLTSLKRLKIVLNAN